MEAINSINGRMLWNFTHSTERVDIMNLYTAQFIQDLDGDGVVDLLNIHGGDPFGEPGLGCWVCKLIIRHTSSMYFH